MFPTSLLADVSGVITRDAGHALNAGSNLITNGSLHGAGNPLGRGLVSASRSLPGGNSGPIVNLAAQSPAPQQYTPVQPIQQVNGATTGGSGGGTGGNSVYTGGSGGYTQASTVGGSSYNPADVAALQDQINGIGQMLQNADIQRGNGQANIDRNYQSGYNQLTDQQNQTMQRYDTQRQNTMADYQKNQGQINANSRNSFNSLQRLLAGSGSAAEILAPYLVAQQANQQKSGSADAFAKNNQSLDQATQDAQFNFKNALDNLLSQKNDKLSSLLSSIDQQKIQLQQQLGAANNQLNVAKGGGYVTPAAQNAAISQLLAEQQGLSSQYADPIFQVQHVSTQAPDLSQYQASAAQLAGGNNQADASAGGDLGNALAAFLKQQKDQQGTNSSYAY